MKQRLNGNPDTVLKQAVIGSLMVIIGVGVAVAVVGFGMPYAVSAFSFIFKLLIKFCDAFDYATLICSFLTAWVIITYIVLREKRLGTSQVQFEGQYRKLAYFAALVTSLNIWFFIGYCNRSLPFDSVMASYLVGGAVAIIWGICFCCTVLDKVRDGGYLK